jgi:hypothetical protein
MLLFRLTRHFDRDPAIVGGLVALACRGIAIEGANEVLQSGPVGKDARDALERELSQYDVTRVYVGTLKTGLACDLDLARELPWNQHWVSRAFSYAAQSCQLDLMREYLEAASKPFYEGKAPEPFPAAQGWWWGSPNVLVIKTLRPSLDAYRGSVENHRASIRVLRLLNALQTRVGADAGQPSKLPDLGLPSDVITDPFDGQPLRVKKLPQGWLIYSVGPNGIDDGGVLDNKTDVGLGPPGYERRTEKNK